MGPGLRSSIPPHKTNLGNTCNHELAFATAASHIDSATNTPHTIVFLLPGIEASNQPCDVAAVSATTCTRESEPTDGVRRGKSISNSHNRGTFRHDQPCLRLVSCSPARCIRSRHILPAAWLYRLSQTLHLDGDPIDRGITRSIFHIVGRHPRRII